MKKKHYLIIFLSFLITSSFYGQVLEVKEGKRAIVKETPDGNASHIDTLEAGTFVWKLGDYPRYNAIQTIDGTTGYSYKGNFKSSNKSIASTLSKKSLLAKTDALKIIVIDVEVGDATLIICPEENGIRDVLLIDTGVNDGDRICQELKNNGFVLANQPITRFYNSHYDQDHMGDVSGVSHLIKVAYDTGEKDVTYGYKKALKNIDRRTMSLSYEETFSGGVNIECVAVNNATIFNPNQPAHKKKNNNSIALIISYNGFDYFTGGDLTFSSEKQLAKGIKNCDAYHVNHHGSSATSSCIEFIEKLDPEIAVVSNGTSHGHPTEVVAKRLTNYGCKFYQTNVNPKAKANHPPNKYIGDTTYLTSKAENKEGATGSIRIVVDNTNYYVIMPNLPLDEGVFPIEKLTNPVFR